MPQIIRLPIGPGPAKQLLKVVKAMHKEVDGRLTRLEGMLEQAAGAKAPRKRKPR